MKMLEKNLPESMKVRVFHQHLDTGKLDSTVAVVYDKDSGVVVGMGRALVNHRKEKSPSRKMGRTVAVGRAMRQAVGRKRKPFMVDMMREEPYIDWTRFAQGEQIQFDD